MRCPIVFSIFVIAAAVSGCGTTSDSTSTNTQPDVAERLTLAPGECTSTLLPGRRLRLICAQDLHASADNLGLLKGQLYAIEQSYDQLLAEKVWLEQLLTTAQVDNQSLAEKLAAVSQEESGKVAQLKLQVEFLSSRVAELAAEKASLLSADDDRDGVANLEDLCADTLQGLLVDQTGCALNQEIVPRGVNFAWNSTDLEPRSQRVLNTLAIQLKHHPHLSFEVAGHTDNTGDASSNLRISAQRAGAVREYLVARGIPDTRLSVRGYGNEKPIADNATAAGRALNRRVSLYRPGQQVSIRR